MINMAAAATLLFCCVYYFVQNVKMFFHDFGTYLFFAPVILLLGIIFVCFYIIMLWFNLADKKTYLADRFDLPYKIVFSVTLIMLITRSFLGDIFDVYTKMIYNEANPEGIITHAAVLAVPVPVIVLAILSGIVTWCLPKIRDNDNMEF